MRILRNKGWIFTGFGGEYFYCSEDEEHVTEAADEKDKSFLKGYKAVLNSKSMEDSMVGSFFLWKSIRLKSHFGSWTFGYLLK